jgi:hypothetical protein
MAFDVADLASIGLRILVPDRAGMHVDPTIMQHARHAVRLGLAVLALLATRPAWAQRPTAGDGQRPLGVSASPDQPKVTLRIGQERRFRVESIGSDVTHRWTFDDRPVGTSAQWTFAPAAAQVGVHRLDVVVTGGEGVVRRRWWVRVLPPRPPRVLQASPAGDDVEVVVQRSVRLELRVAPTAPDETVHVAWTLDGDPVGEGETLRLRPGRVGTQRVRAVATSSLGSAVAREWQLVVTAPTTTTTVAQLAARETTTTTEPPPPPTLPPTLPPVTSTTLPAPLPVVTTTTTVPVAVATRATTPPPAATAGVGDAEVRGLLDRYAAAMRAHDVGELRRLGQITSDKQAEAMEGYFAGVRELDVQVKVLDVRGDGDGTTVRFTRRDSFRDPTGRLVTQESPPIEKRVERTAGGLRFAPAQ